MSLNLRRTVISAPMVRESSVTADCRNVSVWINSLIHVEVSFLVGKGEREEGKGKRMAFLFYHHGRL